MASCTSRPTRAQAPAEQAHDDRDQRRDHERDQRELPVEPEQPASSPRMAMLSLMETVTAEVAAEVTCVTS